MQIIPNEKILKNKRVQDSKDFNQQYFATQSEKGEQLVSMMLANKTTFLLMDGDIVELSTKMNI